VRHVDQVSNYVGYRPLVHSRATERLTGKLETACLYSSCKVDSAVSSIPKLDGYETSLCWEATKETGGALAQRRAGEEVNNSGV
jgi:hypothetical protein